MEMGMQTAGAKRAAERSRQFRNLLEANHAYRRGIDPEPFWPGMWMWELIVAPRRDHMRTVPLSRIIHVVCKRYHLADNELLSASRYGKDVRARHIAFYLARKHTLHSFTSIGRKFGRDHSTVLYGHRNVAERMTANPAFKVEVETLAGML